MSGSFHAVDWAVLVVYVAGATWLGRALSGKQQTIRDFFLGGRRLPWPAVAGSIVATEISGVTFVGLSAIAYADKGNFTYLQLWVGYVVARVLIGFFFVPAFYRRDIYSPYQFIGQRFGPGMDRVTSGLFMLGGFLAQGARIFLAALVLNCITGVGIPVSIAVIGAISIVWTWLGGINTVVWTDVVQFCLMVVGAVAAIVAVVAAVPGGLGGILEEGSAKDKFKVFEWATDPTVTFTLWAGLVGGTFQGLASHGTDQMLAQRLLCCRDERAARKAIIASSVGGLFAVLMLLVGVGLFVYFRHYGLTEAEQAKLAERKDYILPIFILRAMPIGVKGLLFATIFAAAVSTGTSILSAISQTALMTFYRPLFGAPTDPRREIRLSRAFILVAGVILCGSALMCSRIEKYGEILNLALAMAVYTYGPVLGAFLLALSPYRRDGRGLLLAVPLTVLLIFGLEWQHHAWVRFAVVAAMPFLAVPAFRLLWGDAARLTCFFVAAAAVGTATWLDLLPDLAWPWIFPVGTITTLGLGILLGRPASEKEGATAPRGSEGRAEADTR